MRGRRGLLASAVMLCLVVGAWVAGAGSIPLVSSSGDGSRVVLRVDDAPESAEAATARGVGDAVVADPVSDTFARVIGYSLLVLLGIMVLAVAVALLVGLRRNLATPSPEPVAPVDTLLEALARDRVQQRDTLQQGLPSDAIVGCWIRLERTVEASGIRLEASMTPAETVLHVLRNHAVDDEALSGLAALYREARFSAHTMGEDRRAEAVALLDRVHQTLLASRGLAASAPGSAS